MEAHGSGKQSHREMEIGEWRWKWDGVDANQEVEEEQKRSGRGLSGSGRRLSRKGKAGQGAGCRKAGLGVGRRCRLGCPESGEAPGGCPIAGPKDRVNACMGRHQHGHWNEDWRQGRTRRWGEMSQRNKRM